MNNYRWNDHDNVLVKTQGNEHSKIITKVVRYKNAYKNQYPSNINVLFLPTSPTHSLMEKFIPRFLLFHFIDLYY